MLQCARDPYSCTAGLAQQVTAQEKHIVDVLIEERAERLMQRPAVWRFVKRYIYPLLGYDRAIEMVDQVQPLSGLGIFRHLSDELDMNVSVSGLDRVPKEGLTILMPNHPAGIADGIAVYDALKAVREDVIFFANRDAVRAAPQLEEMIIPVEWMEDRKDHTKSKQTVRTMLRAFKDQRMVVIFPSGRLARPTWRGLVERPWLSTGTSLAQKYGCPIQPLHIRGTNSALYYFLWFFNEELKDMTLFRELLNKQGQTYNLTFGEPFVPQGDPEELTPRIREFVTQDMPRGQVRFNPSSAAPLILT